MNDSLWFILAALINIFVLLYSVKNGTFFLEGDAVAPNTFPPPLLLKIILVFSGLVLHLSYNFSLHENCPFTEFFLVRIFPHSDWILRTSPYSVRKRENTDQKKLRIWTLFTQCFFFQLIMMKVIMKRGWNKVLQIFIKVLGIIC